MNFDNNRGSDQTLPATGGLAAGNADAKPDAAANDARYKKHRWSQAVAERVFIRRFKKEQDGLIFSPRPNELEPLKSPEQYDELKPYHVTERTLVTDKRFNTIPHATITVWEKKADPGKPHVFYFSSRTGHVADTGKPPVHIEGFDRKAGLKFLEEIAKSGAGFTAVTLSGYGNNKGAPSEKAFRKDINVLIDDWMKHKDRVPANRLIVAGYSLGTANAAIMASELTKRGQPPAVLTLANGFSSMVTRAKEFVDDFLRKHPDNRLAHLNLTEDKIKSDILHHPFETNARVAELSQKTHLYIATSGKDELVDPAHSRRLESIAKDHGIPVTTQLFPDCGHATMPVCELAQGMLAAYERLNVVANDRAEVKPANGVLPNTLWTTREADKSQIFPIGEIGHS